MAEPDNFYNQAEVLKADDLLKAHLLMEHLLMEHPLGIPAKGTPSFLHNSIQLNSVLQLN